MTRIRHRQNEADDPQWTASPGSAGGGTLARARQESGDLLAAARKAINRVFSGNSEAFLEAAEQDVGQ